MTDVDATAPPARRRRALALAVLLPWTVLYLAMMAHGGWPWASQQVLAFGTVPQDTSVLFGAVVPTAVQGGAWQRVLLSAWLHPSLLSLLLLAWFQAGTGGRLAALVGQARAWIVFVAGGSAGALAHTWAHADTRWAGGAGPFDAVLAGVGASLAWAFTHRGPTARRLRRSGLVTVVIVALLTWWFARDGGPAAAPLLGIESSIGGFLAGILVLLLLGPRRCDRPAAGGTRALAALLAILTLAAAGRQVLAAREASARDDVRAFLERLERAEYRAWRLSAEPEAATPERRARLAETLDRLSEDRLPEGAETRAALAAYLEALRAWTQPVRLPWVAEGAARKAFGAWYEQHEEPLREHHGLPGRSSTARYWRTP